MMQIFVLAVFVLISLKLFDRWLKKTKGMRGERRVARAIALSGFESMNDLIIPDGRGGLTQIDHLIKLPVGIAVIETKNYSGRIFGKEREATWTQVIGRQKNKFQNPLRQNYLHVEAIKKLVPENVDVFGQVLFVGDAKFKEMPEGVSSLRELTKHLNLPIERGIPQHIHDAWDAIEDSVLDDPGARERHLLAIKMGQA